MGKLNRYKFVVRNVATDRELGSCFFYAEDAGSMAAVVNLAYWPKTMEGKIEDADFEEHILLASHEKTSPVDNPETFFAGLNEQSERYGVGDSSNTVHVLPLDPIPACYPKSPMEWLPEEVKKWTYRVREDNERWDEAMLSRKKELADHDDAQKVASAPISGWIYMNGPWRPADPEPDVVVEGD